MKMNDAEYAPPAARLGDFFVAKGAGPMERAGGEAALGPRIYEGAVMGAKRA